MVKKFSTFDSQLVFAEQTESAVALTNEQKLSLYKKSQKSGISTDILEEVYQRGYSIWNESFGQTAEQFAFDRVNSFISGGFAAELDEDLLNELSTQLVGKVNKTRLTTPSKTKAAAETLNKAVKKVWSKTKVGAAEYNIEEVKEPTGKLKDACWNGYTAVGMKMKNGRKVPNCVPVKEQTKTPHETSKHFKTPETSELQSVDKNDPDSRLMGTSSATEIYRKETPGQTIKRVVREVLEIDENWQDSKYKNPTGGLTKAGVMAYRREHPGSKLKTAVTTEPSKLKPGSKAANRRKSFCARMTGMKKRLTSAKTAHDPDSRINKSLRKWNCEETIKELSVPLGTTGKRENVSTPMVAIRMASGKIEKHPPGKSGSSGGGGK
jgi:hypothetical protein